MNWIVSIALFSLGILLSGCSNLTYLYQAASGHIEIISKAESIEEVLAKAETGPELSKQLRYAQQIREFSIDVLSMPDNKSYRSYVDLGRGAVVWNVIATPADSLVPRKWCYPFFGCVSYKGFYAREDAVQLAERMKVAGDDVVVLGIPAYSTLGFTADPLLNTFIYYPPGNLARMIFHELAHQVVYLDDDTRFNESFATAVEELGARAWLSGLGDESLIAEYGDFEVRRQAFKLLLAKAREDLEAIYADPVSSREKKLEAKTERFALLLKEYESIKREQWSGYSGYDAYMTTDMNNAKIAMAGLYNQYVPGFKLLFAQCKADFSLFYKAVDALGAYPEDERTTVLLELSQSDERALNRAQAICDLNGEGAAHQGR